MKRTNITIFNTFFQFQHIIVTIYIFFSLIMIRYYRDNMKKIILILILIVPIFVFADLSIEQQDDVASFAKNFIIKGNSTEHIKGKFGILAYGQETRNEGFNNQLSLIKKDYIGMNIINDKKWVFDCASFAAYVYYHTLNVHTILGNNRPYVVKEFVSDAMSKKMNFYFIMQNVTVSNIDYNQLQKGDLIIIVGEHIMVYVGEGNIAHFTSSAINSLNLGCEVTDLKTKYPQHKVSVIRLLDGVVPKNRKANTLITWPDTKKTEDLSDPDNIPTINVTYQDKIAQEINIEITINDDKGITGYQVAASTPSTYINVDRQKEFKIDYTITKNGTYKVYAKDSRGQIATYEFTIKNIDNIQPKIIDVDYSLNKSKNTFQLEIKATDTNDLLYSIDDDNYQKSNYFNNIRIGKHLIKVKDTANNIAEYEIELSENMIPSITLNYDATNYTQELIVNIIAKDITGIKEYNVTTIDKKPNNFLPYQNNLTYTINSNGTYYFWIKNNKDIVINKSIIINNIDNTPPTINDVKITKILNKYNIDINASDLQCQMITYSLDGINYQEKNSFKFASLINNTLYIKDKCNNVTTYKINANEIFNINIMILIIIIIVIIGILIIYYIKKKRNAISLTNNENY